MSEPQQQHVRMGTPSLSCLAGLSLCCSCFKAFRASVDQVDRQEAELNAEQRRLQIERANKILFDESDRVKNFHSTLMKADTMAENEVLMGYKKQIAVLRKAQEAAFVEQQRQALEVRGRPHGRGGAWPH